MMTKRWLSFGGGGGDGDGEGAPFMKVLTDFEGGRLLNYVPISIHSRFLFSRCRSHHFLQCLFAGVELDWGCRGIDRESQEDVGIENRKPLIFAVLLRSDEILRRSRASVYSG